MPSIMKREMHITQGKFCSNFPVHSWNTTTTIASNNSRDLAKDNNINYYVPHIKTCADSILI